MRKENKRSFVVCRLNSMELVCQNYWKIIKLSCSPCLNALRVLDRIGFLRYQRMFVRVNTSQQCKESLSEHSNEGQSNLRKSPSSISFQD